MKGVFARRPAKRVSLGVLVALWAAVCGDWLCRGASAEQRLRALRRNVGVSALLPELTAPSFVLSSSQATIEGASKATTGEAAEGVSAEREEESPLEERSRGEGAVPSAETLKTAASENPPFSNQRKDAVNQILAGNILRVSEAMSRDSHSSASGSEFHLQKEPSALEQLRSSERRCKIAPQAFIIVDGGSTKTRAQLFSVLTESCPFRGRRVLRDSITFLEEGQSFAGLRSILESWLDAHAGTDWASKPFKAESLLESYPSMQSEAKALVENILSDAGKRLNSHFQGDERLQAQSLGVPVFFHSTAGVRGFHDWYCAGFLTAAREAINAFQGFGGFIFFTNERMTRPISGEEEGINAFLTANHALGKFAGLLGKASAADRKTEAGGPSMEERALQEQLLGIVEVGGASMQIVFPVSALASYPAFVKVRSLQQSGYLTSDYQRVDVLAVSFMQLGASSASGVFLKAFCGEPRNRRESVCLNPCLPKGFKQTCSTGSVMISADGRVQVSSERNSQRVKPAATYCSGSNREISEKALNRLSCFASGINPDLPLDQRLQIEGCSDMEGTGDFDACASAVDALLLDPPVPLPANQEASSTGFDTPGQIFKFISSPAPMYVTGLALVAPVKKLQELGLLPANYAGNAEDLLKAARLYCQTPVQKATNGGLSQIFRIKGLEREEAVNSFSYDNCMRLAMAERLLRQMQAGTFRPSQVFFEHTMTDPKTKTPLGEFGWHVGTIFKNVIREREWSRDAYELGIAHTLQERMAARQSSPNLEKSTKGGEERQEEGQVAR